jgi:hypothetical protein
MLPRDRAIYQNLWHIERSFTGWRLPRQQVVTREQKMGLPDMFLDMRVSSRSVKELPEARSPHVKVIIIQPV